MPITCRPLTTRDEPFLAELYHQGRAAEVAAWGWGTAQAQAFLTFQFRAQRQHYQHQPADERIICRDDRPIGWLALVTGDDALWLSDISLLPAERGAGIGSVVLQCLIAEANGAGVPLRLHVRHGVPALRLYQRLGFIVIGNDSLHLTMEYHQLNTAS